MRFEVEPAALMSEASIVAVPLESLEIVIGRRSDSPGYASSLRCASSSPFSGCDELEREGLLITVASDDLIVWEVRAATDHSRHAVIAGVSISDLTGIDL